MATLRQQKAVEKLVEKGGTEKSLAQVMTEVGYSPETAKTPAKLTESEGFKELMDKYIPEDLLMKVHREGLEANKVVSARVTNKEAGVDTDDFIEIPDHPTRHKYLETGYKLRGKMSGEGAITNIIIPITVRRGESPTQGDSITSSSV